jgi:hypothetical protein
MKGKGSIGGLLILDKWKNVGTLPMGSLPEQFGESLLGIDRQVSDAVPLNRFGQRRLLNKHVALNAANENELSVWRKCTAATTLADITHRTRKEKCAARCYNATLPHRQIVCWPTRRREVAHALTMACWHIRYYHGLSFPLRQI